MISSLASSFSFLMSMKKSMNSSLQMDAISFELRGHLHVDVSIVVNVTQTEQLFNDTLSLVSVLKSLQIMN